MRVFIFCLLVVVSGLTTAVYGQTKKVKIKDEKHTVFTYVADSSCLTHKENKELLKSFHAFFQAVENDNYDGYTACLSATTLEKIPKEKLERKFEKFKGYGVHLSDEIHVRYISTYEGKSSEKNPIYICVVELPEDQSIEKRVGFDPLKKQKFENAGNHVGLHFTQAEDGSYKVVILW